MSIRETSSIQNAGRLETIVTPSDPSSPSVILLHGASGAGGTDRLKLLFTAALGSESIGLQVLHYFESTGTSYASDALIARHAQTWNSAVVQAVSELRKQRPDALLFLAGYSLGGFLAAAAMTARASVDGIMVIGGGIDEESASKATHAKPTLVCHGGRDSRVPLKEAERLVATVKRLGVEPEFHVFPDDGHYFSPSSWMGIAELCLDFVRRLSRR